MNPLVLILIVSIILILLLVLFLPEKGIIAFRKNAGKMKEKILIEDTLKMLFDNEYKAQPSSVNALAGSMGVPVDSLTELIPKLEGMSMIDASNINHIQLTEEGRSYALRVIRIHRLWERYLADETSIEEKDWHNKADKREHKMTLNDADALAARIGNPVVDPHGDPIPSSSGEIPDYEGTQLHELSSGDIVKILHIEDEPKTIYTQILALGLFPGMELRIIDVSPEKVLFEFNGEERILAPLFAANITVKKRSKAQSKIASNLLLSKLKKGDKAKIVGISPACRKPQKRRLMDLGIVPGTEVEVALSSVGNNPRAYRIMNTLIALRKKHASFIFVEPINQENVI